ncbi:hypothetical protein [Halomonas sp.]
MGGFKRDSEVGMALIFRTQHN